MGTISLKDLQLPSHMCKNSTLFLHAFVQSGNTTLNYRLFPLSQFLVPIEERDSKHFLLDSSFDPTNITVNQLPFSSIPTKIEVGVILETRQMDKQELYSRGFGRYIDPKTSTFHFPVHVNPFISPRDEYVSLIDCPAISSFEISYKPIGMSYWMLSEILIRSFDNLEDNMKLNEYDIDSFKMLITGSSTLKLAVVYFVSLLHFVFEYLSIKSDLSFWKNRTNFNGISESSISMNVGMGLISALYVIEQGESKIALYFILIKMFMNLWKIYKMRQQTSSSVSDNSLSADDLESIHDDEKKCMKYLFLILTPLVALFCLFRLIYYKYRSWYSWGILSLTAASEVFGFVTMTPQIFMNHRLKSVEHLPWSALTYSFINTFIDDLFAFGIFRVPEVSRYSCLRDDIVFIVICVQRWLYKDRRLADEHAQDNLVEPTISRENIEKVTEMKPILDSKESKSRRSARKVVKD